MTRTIFGSTLSALIAVLEFSKSENIIWVQSSPIIGGHFSGFQMDGLGCDLGMVVLEPYSGNELPGPLPNFPPIKQSGLSFVHLVRKWLTEYGETFEPISISTNLFGLSINDYLIADDLEVLRKLDWNSKSQIISELAKILEQQQTLDMTHPINKNRLDKFITSSTADVITATLGPTFYNLLIKPWTDKIQLDFLSKLPARDHRSGWVPLYYPDTALQILTDKLSSDTLKKPFMVPKASSVSSLVHRLQDQVDQSRVEIIPYLTQKVLPKKGDVILDSNKWARKYLGGNEEITLKDSLRVPITLLILKFGGVVAADKIINIVEPSIGPYRISIRNILGSEVHSIITLEFGEKFRNFSDGQIKTCAAQTLKGFGVTVKSTSESVKRLTMNLPGTEDRRILENQRIEIYKIFQNKGLLGYPIDFGSSTFNDQILLGLWSKSESQDLKNVLK